MSEKKVFSGEIRRMQAEDAPVVAAIEEILFSDAWSKEAFLDSMAQPGTICLSAVLDDEVVGYAILYTVLDEGELVNIAVELNHQGEGIGRALLGELLSQAKGQGVRQVFLEVRRYNDRARALYESFDFHAYAMRPGFYERPKEDAICMMLTIS